MQINNFFKFCYKKMQNAEYLLSIYLIFALSKLSLELQINNGVVTPSFTMFKDMEGQCNTYCFGIVKPILQQTKQYHFSELQDRIKELNVIIKNTEIQLSDVQIKLGVCQDTNKNRETLSTDQLQEKVTQLTELKNQWEAQEEKLKSMENHLSNLTNRLGICGETIKHRDVQFAQLQDLNVSCNNSSKTKDDLIATNKVLINQLRSANQADLIKQELKDRDISKLEAQIKNKEKIIKQHKSKIDSDVLKIKQLTDKLIATDFQLKKYESSNCFHKSSDIHVIRVAGHEPFSVYCDSALAEGGWTVIQRRRDGSVSFNRNWTDYRLGFGDLRGEFFIGLDKIHLLTKSQHHELYIHLQDFNDENRYAYYDHFEIAGESKEYELMSLGEYKGSAGDALISQRHMKFSTPDRDNDKAYGNCAHEFRSGWWYRKCYYCNLNGEYFNAKTTNHYGINWFAWHKNPLQFVQIMIRPKAH